MVRARYFANVAACRAVRIPVGAGFSEKYHISPLSILGYSFDVVYLGKALVTPLSALLDSGENEYLVGQRCQCARLKRRYGCRTALRGVSFDDPTTS